MKGVMIDDDADSIGRSKDFNDIIAKCLVKMPSGRSTAGALLDHPFLASVTDYRPLRFLYQVLSVALMCRVCMYVIM